MKRSLLLSCQAEHTQIVDVVVLSGRVVVIRRHGVCVRRIRLVVVIVVLLIHVCVGCWPIVLGRGAAQDVQSARWASLLPLEPRAQTGCVENVAAGQLLRSVYHILTANSRQSRNLFVLRHPSIASYRQMMQMLSDCANSSGVASG